MDILTIIATLGMLMWWLVKPIRDSLERQASEINEIRKDVKHNAERNSRIEGIIWADIDEAAGKKGKK